MVLWASCPANPHDEASKSSKNMRWWAFSTYLQILLALNGFCLLAMVIVGRLAMAGSAQFGYVLFLTFIAIFLLTAFFNYLLVPFTLLRAILSGIVLAYSCKGHDFCPSCINSNACVGARPYFGPGWLRKSAGILVLLGKFVGRQIAQRAVRTLLIVMLAPLLDFSLDFPQRAKPMRIQKLLIFTRFSG